MTTTNEPTAEARAAALALVREIHMRHELFGSALPEIALALDAIRAQGVEQAEKERDEARRERDRISDMTTRDLRRIASLEAELARVREAWEADKKLAAMACDEYALAMKMAHSPERLREVAQELFDWHDDLGQIGPAKILAVLQRHFGEEVGK